MYTEALGWCVAPLERHTERKWVSFGLLQCIWHLPVWWHICCHQQHGNFYVTVYFASVDMGAWVKWSDPKIKRNVAITSRTHLLSVVEPQEWRKQSSGRPNEMWQTFREWGLIFPDSITICTLRAEGSRHHSLLWTVYHGTSTSQGTQILELHIISFVCSPLTSARILIHSLSLCSLIGCSAFQIITPIASDVDTWKGWGKKRKRKKKSSSLTADKIDVNLILTRADGVYNLISKSKGFF